jgi:serine/threonine protein kinase
LLHCDPPTIQRARAFSTGPPGRDTLAAVELGAPHRELAAGDVFGSFRLEAMLGEGGMGLVFKARREDGDFVALKVLKAALSEDDVYAQRFLHEARSAAEVRHPNLVPILETGEADGRRYLAAAFVEGRTLEARIRTYGPLSVEALLRVAAEVAAGLEALHADGVVHRDVKAANILVRDADGSALLTDFGLAKGRAYTVLTRPGQVLGTLEYLAPELIRGHPATPASDLYALGCVLFECAAGRTPFGDRQGLQIGMAHLGDEPPDPGAGRADWPPALSSALLTALAKEPDERPPTATAYVELLRTASI